MPPNRDFRNGLRENSALSVLPSRRHFLQQIFGAGAVFLSGLDQLGADPVPTVSPGAFRFAFVTDLHLLDKGLKRSAKGMAACLDAVEKLNPKPEFILVGGDLVNDARHLAVAEAEKRLDFFLQIWKDHTSLPSHWVFGNHDLVAVNIYPAPESDPHYGKGLFQDRLQLPSLFYSFDFKGWHFVVLDDVVLLPNHNYTGELADAELAFLKADLDAHASMPTVICAHIPLISSLPLSFLFAKTKSLLSSYRGTVVCTNGDAIIKNLPGHNVRAILSGHLHHYDVKDLNGVRFITSGAVCGNYWNGPMLDCPEGFGVVDLGTDGSVDFKYRDYGWTAG